MTPLLILRGGFAADGLLFLLAVCNSPSVSDYRASALALLSLRRSFAALAVLRLTHVFSDDISTYARDQKNGGSGPPEVISSTLRGSS